MDLIDQIVLERILSLGISNYSKNAPLCLSPLSAPVAVGFIYLSIYLYTEQVCAKTTREFTATVLIAHRTGTTVTCALSSKYLKRRSDDDDKVGNNIKKGDYWHWDPLYSIVTTTCK